MKYVFLDLDGVVNNTGSVLCRTSTKWTKLSSAEHTEAYVGITRVVDEIGYGPQQAMMSVEPTAIELVNRLTARQGEISVVLSTSHRTYFTGEDHQYACVYGSELHLQLLRWYMQLLGLKFNLVGITPKLYKARGEEVQAYLDALDEEPEAYVILDDATDFLPSQKQNFVQTNPDVGFTAIEYFQAAKILGIPESIIIF